MVATKRLSLPEQHRRTNLADSLISRTLSVRRQFQYPPHHRALLNELLQGRLSRQLPYTLRPSSYRIGAYNKIFACDWLDSDTVLLASKCNHLLRLSLLDGAVERIPLLGLPASQPGGRHPRGPPPGFGNDGGVHALELNQPAASATFLATGAKADGDLGVYQLPSLRPYTLLHGAHNDWVFDASWLDPATLVSVARDSTLAVWSLPERGDLGDSAGGDGLEPSGCCSSLTLPRYRRSLTDLHGQSGAKLRSIDVGRCGSLAVLSLNCFLQFYSPERLDTPVSCIELGASDCSLAKETVCVRASPDPHCFFSCCVDQVTLYDSRLNKGIFSVESNDATSGVRSLACNGPVLSYGTGVGNVYFYDCRSRRHLRSQLPLPRRATNPQPDSQQQQQQQQHQLAPLPLFRDHNYQQVPSGYNAEYAIYSHKYDADRMRIFAAGGPLATTYWGNLAVLHA